MATSGVVLSVDPGTKRIGIAISDPERKMALPLEVVEVSGSHHVERVMTLVKERGVAEIIVGFPIRLDGTEGQAAQSARRLADDIRSQVEIPVILVDERLSTVQAGRNLAAAGMESRRARRVIDSVAAAILLQSYLDSKGSE